jgi:hypothetical protein
LISLAAKNLSAGPYTVTELPLQKGLQPFLKKLPLIGQIKLDEIEPRRKALNPIAFMKHDAVVCDKHTGRKEHVEDGQNLVPRLSFVREEVLHENRRTSGLNCYAQPLFQFADHGSLCGFAKLNRATKGPYADHMPRVIQDLGCPSA